MTPSWLPPQIPLNGGNVRDDYEKLFEVFKRDFIDKDPPHIDGRRILYDTHINSIYSVEQYPYGFTHMVTTSGVNSYIVRTIDIERAKKLPWARAIIENYTDPEVRTFWATRPDGTTSLYLWLYNFDYIIIMREMRNNPSNIIVTAYHVHSEKRRTFQRLFENAIRIL